MRDHAEVELDGIIDFLEREAPWELERFRSLDQLASSELDWAEERALRVDDAYSRWLKEMFALFRRRAAFDTAI